jgi:O-antigen/teichoic acid export membrane protein
MSAHSSLSAQNEYPALSRGNAVDARTEPVTPGLSLRSNFAWVLTGNVVYAACQWGMIVALARLGSTVVVGQFSLGLAIATPVLTFTNLHLRAMQATDAKRSCHFTEYRRLRMLTTLVGMAVIAGVAWLGAHQAGTVMVIMAVAAAKGMEALSDIYYGLFQLNDRLDQTAKSQMFRGVTSVLALSAGLYVTHNLLWGCIGLVLASLASLLFLDVRRGRDFFPQPAGPREYEPRRQWSLMRLALPLGIATTLASINLNMPRYFIHARMGDYQLGIFSALAYATVAITLVSDSLGHCVIPRMSRLYAGRQFPAFRFLFLRLLALGAALGLSGLVVAQVLGARLLTVVYGPEYAAHLKVFVALMLAAAIHCAASVFTSGIMSARCFGIQVPVYAAMVGSNALACAVWVPTLGLAGGAMAMVLAAVVRLVLSGTIMGYLILAPARRDVNPEVPCAKGLDL